MHSQYVTSACLYVVHECDYYSFTHPIWLTQMQWSTFANVISRNLFVRTADESANPNNEWSVNTVWNIGIEIISYYLRATYYVSANRNDASNVIFQSFWGRAILLKHSQNMIFSNLREFSVTLRPNNLPMIMTSWARLENAEWPWTMSIRSRIKMYRMRGRAATIVGRMAWL